MRTDLVGKMLTVVDASVSDPAQRKAVKDLVEQSLWGAFFNYAESLRQALETAEGNAQSDKQ
jgi:hypothetical protein